MNLLFVAALLVEVASATALPVPPASPSLSTPPLFSGRHRELVEELTYLGVKERRRNEEDRIARKMEEDGSKTQRDEEVHQHHKDQPRLHEGFRENYPHKHQNRTKKSKTKHTPMITGTNLILNGEEAKWMDEEKEEVETPWEDKQETADIWQQDTGIHFFGYDTQRSSREERKPWEKQDDRMEEPLALPVTEWKKTQYPDLPDELMPIRPGEGSRFEDLEREKLEREKMSQTKGVEEDTTDTATSHDAESLSSCTASLCLSFLILFFTSLRILI